MVFSQGLITKLHTLLPQHHFHLLFSKKNEFPFSSNPSPLTTLISDGLRPPMLHATPYLSLGEFYLPFHTLFLHFGRVLRVGQIQFLVLGFYKQVKMKFEVQFLMCERGFERLIKILVSLFKNPRFLGTMNLTSFGVLGVEISN